MSSDENIFEEYNLDPWGRRRNPDDWSYNNVPALQITDRGFTGHEHLDDFGLINMNGRMYDPVLGRFLGVDPIISDVTSSQAFNGYSYCSNNPLKYIDPSGYTMFEVLGDRSDYEGGGFFYRGSYYGYNGDVGNGRSGGYISSGGLGGRNAIYGGVSYEQTTDYYTAHTDNEGNWVLTGYINSETRQWTEWSFLGYEDPQSQGGNIYNVKNYGEIIGLTVSYYKDDRYPGYALLELSYTANGNNGAKWKQWYKDTDYSDMSAKPGEGWDGKNPPYYYTDAKMAEHTNGNTVDFYDNPWRYSAGRYDFTLTLVGPEGTNILQINWGMIYYSNHRTVLLPLIVKKF